MIIITTNGALSITINDSASIEITGNERNINVLTNQDPSIILTYNSVGLTYDGIELKY